MKFYKRTFLGTQIVSCFLCLVALPVVLLANLYPYFFFSFGRFDVYSRFDGLPAVELNGKFSEVLQFINIPFNTNLDPSFFSTEDILHMQDVRNLFLIVNMIFVLTFTISLVSVLYYKGAERIWLITKTNRLLFIFICLLVILGIYLIFTWNTGFQTFHQLVFPYNNYWQLDPRSSNLIKFLPEQIFQELALLYFVVVCMEYLALKLSVRIFERSET